LAGIFPLIHCQTVYKVKVNIFCQETNKAPLEFEAVLAAGVYSYLYVCHLFDPFFIFESIYTNLYTKHKFILFLCDGKKALWANRAGQAHSLTSLWIGLCPVRA